MKICSFCGRTEKQVKTIITSKKADICNKCVLLCMDALIDNQREYKEIEFKGEDNNECKDNR